jgi:hypothetical protein
MNSQFITADLLTDKATSQKVYASMLRVWMQALKSPNITITDVSQNFNTIKNFIEEKSDKNTTRKNHFSLMMKISKDGVDNLLYENAEKEFNRYKNLIEGVQEKNELRAGEIVHTADELKTKINKIGDELPKIFNTIQDYRKLMLYLILNFLQKYPVRNDLADSKIFYASNFRTIKLMENAILAANNDKINFIFINDKKRGCTLMKSYFHNAVYKTVSTYGINEFILSGSVEDMFKKYRDVINKFSLNNYWLMNEDGTQMTRSGLSMFLRRRNFSSTSIRKGAVSSVCNPQPEQLKKQKELAKIMGHDLNTQQTYYSKVLSR